jgi:hypothetical protein
MDLLTLQILFLYSMLKNSLSAIAIQHPDLEIELGNENHEYC